MPEPGVTEIRAKGGTVLAEVITDQQRIVRLQAARRLGERDMQRNRWRADDEIPDPQVRAFWREGWMIPRAEWKTAMVPV